MDLKGLTAMKIAGMPAPIVIIAGGGILGLYLRSRNKAKVAATGTTDPNAITQSTNLPTAVDPNTGAVYAIDPATGQSFQLPWNTSLVSVPLGINGGFNPPRQNPTMPMPATPAPTPLDTSVQTAPVGNVNDSQGQILTSNPIGTTVVSNVSNPVPINTTPIQDINAGYVAPQANNTTQVPDVITGQPNYQGSLYMAGDHPFIYG